MSHEPRPKGRGVYLGGVSTPPKFGSELPGPKGPGFGSLDEEREGEAVLHTVALFGEAEKGQYRQPHYCKTVEQLLGNLGQPPPDSQGLHFAIQTLLYERQLIFFRVREEGYSLQDYILGLRLLGDKGAVPSLSALCLPGVGDAEIIEATSPLCEQHHTLLILTQADLYDYLTNL